MERMNTQSGLNAVVGQGSAQSLTGLVTKGSVEYFESRASAIVNSRPDLTRELSVAQRKVIELLLAGYTEPEIAEKLSRSKHTVHDHTKAIYQIMTVSTRVQLLLLFAAPPGVAVVGQQN